MAKSKQAVEVTTDANKRREAVELINSIRQSLMQSNAQFIVAYESEGNGKSRTVIETNGLKIGETAESAAAVKKANDAAKKAQEAADKAKAEAQAAATATAG